MHRPCSLHFNFFIHLERLHVITRCHRGATLAATARAAVAEAVAGDARDTCNYTTGKSLWNSNGRLPVGAVVMALPLADAPSPPSIQKKTDVQLNFSPVFFPSSFG
jgi:hypothetical protein